jgi:hypothetical protein
MSDKEQTLGQIASSVQLSLVTTKRIIGSVFVVRHVA